MGLTDEQYKEFYVAWAREKYHDEAIVDVSFSLSSHGPYSSVTPAVDEFVQVWVRRQEPQPFGRGGQIHEEDDVHALIRELNDFIIDQLSRAFKEANDGKQGNPEEDGAK